MRTIVLLAGVLALTVSQPEPVLSAEVIRITIGDMLFAPAVVTAEVGDTVEWENGDFVDHTATANEDQWDVVIAAGKSAQLTLEQAGEFNYYCRFHPAMTGKIQVRERK